MPLSSPLEHHEHLQVCTHLDAVDEVVTWFLQFREFLPQQVWLEAQIALVESLTNAIRHAHLNHPPKIPIDIDVRWSETRVQFQVWDLGDRYAFESALASLSAVIDSPDFDPLEREKQWGGVIFLKLRRQHGWQITYERHDEQKNCFSAEKMFQLAE